MAGIAALPSRVTTKGPTVSDPHPRRLSGHLRRNVVAYVALVVAFSFSPVPSMAAGLVKTSDIADGAVTRPKLAANSVNSGKVANESLTSADLKNGGINGSDLNLFNDSQCTGETVQGTAIINADPAVPDDYTTNWIGYPHSCTGQPVMVKRTGKGFYWVNFGSSSPSRLAVVSGTINVDTFGFPNVVAGVSYSGSPGRFVVQIVGMDGSNVDSDFTILVY